MLFMRKVAQAGAIAFRQAPGGALVLVARSRRDPHVWIFPKGHIEKGEEASAAAGRELLEETGVIGNPLEWAGRLEFEADGDRVSVDYFLVRAVREIGPGEGREVRWCTLDDALALLTHGSARDLLRSSWSRISHW